MLNRIKGRATYANVASTVALVIAVAGGGAAAASSLVPKNSVKSPQIVNNTVKSVDVKDGSLGGVDIDETSLGQVPDAAHADTADTADGVSGGAINDPGAFGAGDLGIVRAYAWNSLVNTDGPLTGNGYTYNRSGGAVSVDHLGVGSYNVTFEGLNLSGGHFQVSSYGVGATWCKVGGWGGSSVTVLCFNGAGAPADSLFTVAAVD
jgi:hypothetical protein